MAQTDDPPVGTGIDPFVWQNMPAEDKVGFYQKVYEERLQGFIARGEVLEAVLVFLEHVASRDFDEELQGDETKAAELVPLVRKALGR